MSKTYRKERKKVEKTLPKRQEQTLKKQITDEQEDKYGNR